LGGDEFLIVLRDVTDEETTRNIVARLTSAVESLRLHRTGEDPRIGVSIGIGRLREQTPFAHVLREADCDLYKRKGERPSGS
jgi:diguanylate cyclase (GGDEF)-like protein